MNSVQFTKVVGPACVQDLGRVGQLALGLPLGGTMAPSRLRALNFSIGNDPHAAGLEVFGSVTFEVTHATRFAVDGGPAERLEPGQSRTITTDGQRLRILALEGGIDVPSVLGGRGLLPHARMGGHDGRWLRSGDVLPLGALPGADGAHTPHEALPSTPHAELLVPLFPGPDAHLLLSMEHIYAASFRLSRTSDRSGVRLEGPSIELVAREPGAPSLPLVPGAVQVPPNGLPIVLGPDHPVSGGYPVVAVVARSALEPLFVAPLGSTLRFVPSR